jgi:hypothetical protein
MTTKEIITSLSDAITASGKPLKELKSPIFDYLRKNNVSETTWEGIWQKLNTLHNDSKQGSLGTSGSSGTQEPKEDKREKVVDYSQSTSDLKVREPRKTVFGPIKKIAG